MFFPPHVATSHWLWSLLAGQCFFRKLHAKRDHVLFPACHLQLSPCTPTCYSNQLRPPLVACAGMLLPLLQLLQFLLLVCGCCSEGTGWSTAAAQRRLLAALIPLAANRLPLRCLLLEPLLSPRRRPVAVCRHFLLPPRPRGTSQCHCLSWYTPLATAAAICQLLLQPGGVWTPVPACGSLLSIVFVPLLTV